MSGDTLTWFWGIVGLIVAFGLAYFGVRTWSAKQKQRVDRGGTGIQAGGDVNIAGRDAKVDDKP